MFHTLTGSAGVTHSANSRKLRYEKSMKTNISHNWQVRRVGDLPAGDDARSEWLKARWFEKEMRLRDFLRVR